MLRHRIVVGLFLFFVALPVWSAEAAKKKAPAPGNRKTASSVPRAQAKCNIQSIAQQKVSVFQLPGRDQAWIALTRRGKMLFSDLGFRERAEILGNLVANGKGPRNLGPCADPQEKVVSMSHPTATYTVFATKGCTRRLAKELGFNEVNLDHFGSMESGIQILGTDLEVCTDGERVLSCGELDEAGLASSRSCWETVLESKDR